MQNTLSQIRGFKMGSLNIASLTKHLDELKVLMANEPLDILAINESRLDISIPDFHININGYNLIRRDRNRNGGGVCVFIRKSIEFKHRTDLEKLELEMIALSIKKPNSKAFLPRGIDLLILQLNVLTFLKISLHVLTMNLMIFM